jgi:hypothetical protein
MRLPGQPSETSFSFRRIAFILSLVTVGLSVVGTLAAGYYRCWQSDRLALAASIPDDSYYALLPAWNFSRYGIPTFDGIHPAPRRALDPFAAEPGNLQHVIAETARHLDRDLTISHEMKIGSWNAGLLGFLSGASVVNLDGLANDDVVTFLEGGGSMGDYLQRERVQLLVDARPKGEPLWIDDVPLTVVHITPWVGRPDLEPGWFVLRVGPKTTRGKH